MLDGKRFKTRLTIAIAAAYFGPPILGLSFLVGVVQTLTIYDVQRLMSGSVLPFYIVGSGLGAVAFFRWFLRPIVDFANGECDAQVATKRMRSFLWVFWLLFVARHLLGSLLLVLAIETVFPVAPAGNELRMFSLALVLAALVGLPAFVRVIDDFARTFKNQTLQEPVLRVRSRVFLIAVLLPVLVYTAILMYLIPRLGGLRTELITLWVLLLGIAVAAAYNLMRSLDESMSGLRRVSKLGDVQDLHLEELRVRSMDEFGVLTCEYRALLTNLQQHTILLDARNQVLQASQHEADPDAVLANLLALVAEKLQSNRAMLVAQVEAEPAQILARLGAIVSTQAIDLSPKITAAMRSSQPTLFPKSEASWTEQGPREFLVLPLLDSTSNGDTLAIFACFEHCETTLDWAPLQLLVQLSPEIAAALKAARIAKDNATLERMLLNAQRMEIVGRLAAGVAHDFNNILTVILGSASILKLDAAKGPLPAAAVDEHADLIIESSDKAADLTRQLLTFSKPSGGKRRVLDLNQVICGIEVFLTRLLSENISLELDLTPVDNIKANKGLVEQIVTNLVVNAHDAMMKEGGCIKVSTEQQGLWVEMRVIDSGHGMSESVVAHVFEPFFTTKSSENGTGLGLATVYGIIKSLDGSIEIETEPGVGTEMLVRFPASAEKARGESAEIAALASVSGITVLLVEDDEHIRRIIRVLLMEHGYAVVDVATGTEALAAIDDEEQTLDLLLTDVLMPGIKGTEVATHMAAKRPDGAILLMTGYADSDVLARAQAAGRTIMKKPFKPMELLSRLSGVLHDAGASR